MAGGCWLLALDGFRLQQKVVHVQQSRQLVIAQNPLVADVFGDQDRRLWHLALAGRSADGFNFQEPLAPVQLDMGRHEHALLDGQALLQMPPVQDVQEVVAVGRRHEAFGKSRV